MTFCKNCIYRKKSRSCKNCIYRKKSRSKYYKFYCKKTGAMIIDNVMCWGCSEGIDKTGDKQ